jgi:hypothetical protein
MIASPTAPMPARSTTAPALPNATMLTRLHAWSASWADEPVIHLPELPDDLVAALPGAIEQAQRDLEAGDPADVLAALTTLASRRGFELPDGAALEMDVALLASWPRDLFQRAFQRVWEEFAYRRLPEVADFRKYIEAELTERQQQFARLTTFQLKLETVQRRRQWDAAAREKHRRDKQRETNALRGALGRGAAVDVTRKQEMAEEPSYRDSALDQPDLDNRVEPVVAQGSRHAAVERPTERVGQPHQELQTGTPISLKHNKRVGATGNGDGSGVELSRGQRPRQAEAVLSRVELGGKDDLAGECTVIRTAGGNQADQNGQGPGGAANDSGDTCLGTGAARRKDPSRSERPTPIGLGNTGAGSPVGEPYLDPDTQLGRGGTKIPHIGGRRGNGESDRKGAVGKAKAVQGVEDDRDACLRFGLVPQDQRVVIPPDRAGGPANVDADRGPDRNDRCGSVHHERHGARARGDARHNSRRHRHRVCVVRHSDNHPAFGTRQSGCCDGLFARTTEPGGHPMGRPPWPKRAGWFRVSGWNGHRPRLHPFDLLLRAYRRPESGSERARLRQYRISRNPHALGRSTRSSRWSAYNIGEGPTPASGCRRSFASPWLIRLLRTMDGHAVNDGTRPALAVSTLPWRVGKRSTSRAKSLCAIFSAPPDLTRVHRTPVLLARNV